MLQRIRRIITKPFRKKINFGPGEWYFVMHIPKTAGTTFRFTLYDHVESNKIYPNLKELKSKLKARYIPGNEFVNLGLPDSFPDPHKILIGHYPYHFRNQFSVAPKVITFLRDPLTRTKSHLLHAQKLNPKLKGKSIREIFSIQETGLTNMQSRMLGYRPQENNFPEVLQNLKNINFVGITERFKESIEIINHHFNWQLQPHRSMNITSKNSENQFSSELEKSIIKKLDLDYQLYNQAVVIFNTKLEALKTNSL